MNFYQVLFFSVNKRTLETIKMIVIKLFFAVLICTCKIVATRDQCTSPRYQSGNCINILDCPSLLAIFKGPRPIPSITADFLRKSYCGYPKVCCENEDPKYGLDKTSSKKIPNPISADSLIGRSKRRIISERLNTKNSPKLWKVPSCPGKTYCESVKDYPEDMAIKTIEDNPELRPLAITDLLINYKRYIDINDEIALCSSEEKVIFPKSALSSDDEWLYILNTHTFTQGVRIETCTSEGTPCDDIAEFPDEYVSMCKQKYAYRRLVAMHPNGTVISDAWFSFPSSCCCIAKRNDLDKK